MIPDESGGVYVGMDSPSFRGKHIDYFSPGNEPRSFQSSLTGDSREALVARAPSGQVYLVGSQGWSRYAPLRVIAYEANGALLWDRRFDGPTNEFATAVACDSRGNLFIAGMHRDKGGPGPGDFDPMLIKLSSSGGFMWRAVIRNAPFGVHTSIAVNSSDDVLVGGPNGLFKYSNSGQEIWHNPEAITYLRLTRGNEIVTVGNGETVVLQKRSNRGEEIWRTELSAEESFGDVAVDDQGSAYVSTVKWFYPEGPVRPIPIRSMVRKYVDEPVAFELKGTLEPPVLSYCETAGPCGNPAPVPPAAVNAARISPGKLLVCWPTNYGDYRLESTRRVNRRHPERTKWRPVLESVTTNAESLCVTVKVARTGKFFRIMQPQGAD